MKGKRKQWMKVKKMGKVKGLPKNKLWRKYILWVNKPRKKDLKKILKRYEFYCPIREFFYEREFELFGYVIAIKLKIRARKFKKIL